MSRNKAIILGVRVLLFAVLGVLFVLKGMGMELNPMKALFIGIGIADEAYAFLLARPFWAAKPEE